MSRVSLSMMGRHFTGPSFDWLTERSGMRSFRFHDLRHSHATHLLKAGVHPKIVSERMDHAVGVTLDTYSHVLPGMQEDAVRLIDMALASAINKNKPDKA